MTEPTKLEEKVIAKAGKCRKHGPVIKQNGKCPLCFLNKILDFNDETDPAK